MVFGIRRQRLHDLESGGPGGTVERQGSNGRSRNRAGAVSRTACETRGGGGGKREHYAEAIVCLDARTGERVWHFQTVRHGLWDYDLPAAPTLLTINVDGREIDAVAAPAKTGFLYVFDRVTGEPVWPIEDRPVPASDVPGERTAETQPFPTRPAPFAKQGFTEADVIAFTPELREKLIWDTL